LELEIEKLKLELQKKDNVFEEHIKMLFSKLEINTLHTKIDNMEKQITELHNKLCVAPKTVTGFQEPLVTLGPRVQQINPETMELVKVYESATQLMNENHNIKRPSLTIAANANTIYCGFRWMFVERDQDASKLENVQPTKQTRVQNLGYIAKLTPDQTEILNVYLDRKTAAHCNEYNSSSALDTHVKKSTITRGHYYILYENCDEFLKNEFEMKYGEPLLYVSGVGQYDSNNNLIREFSCKYDCIRSLAMSDKTLAKALNNEIMYNGCYFKEIGSKNKML
jgi:hypothetical protein